MSFKGYKNLGEIFFEKEKEDGSPEKAAALQGYGCVGWCFPLRGGSWNNESSAGLGALNLNDLRAIVNNDVGFRPALPPSQKSGLYGGLGSNTAVGSVAAESSAEGKRSRIPSPVSGENMNRRGRLVGGHYAGSRIPSPPPFGGR
jgi:hypothetical protein